MYLSLQCILLVCVACSHVVWFFDLSHRTSLPIYFVLGKLHSVGLSSEVQEALKERFEVDVEMAQNAGNRKVYHSREYNSMKSRSSYSMLFSRWTGEIWIFCLPTYLHSCCNHPASATFKLLLQAWTDHSVFMVDKREYTEYILIHVPNKVFLTDSLLTSISNFINLKN